MLPALGDFVSHSLQMNCETVSASPIPRKRKIAIYRENKILSQGLYNWAYTLFTAQSRIQIQNGKKWKKKNFTRSSKLLAITRLPITADKPHQKQWLQGWRQSMAWLDCSGLCTVFQIKKFTFLNGRRRWRWAKRKKINLAIQQFSYGRNSNSSTLMTLAGMEGSGCSSTSVPNHLARPRGGLPPCRWDPFVLWGPWLCDWGPGTPGCTAGRQKIHKMGTMIPLLANVCRDSYYTLAPLTWSLLLKLLLHYC